MINEVNRVRIFFYVTIPLFLLNFLSFMTAIWSMAKKTNQHNIYFFITAGIMFIIYIVYYYFYKKKRFYSNMIVVSMCLYTIMFLIISEIQYTVNLILFMICVVLIVFGAKRKEIITYIVIFVSSYIIIGVSKALNIGFNTIKIAEKDTIEELYLIICTFLVSLLLIIIYILHTISKKLEKRENEIENEKKFESACIHHDITVAEKPILKLMMEGKNKKQIIIITSLKESNIKSKISSIKNKLNLKMYHRVTTKEIETALYKK